MADDSSFARTVARSLLYTGVGNVGTRLLGLASLVLALRWVSLEAMGLASLVLAITAVLRAAAELSLGAALVQRETLTREHVDALFWLSLGAATAAAGLVVLGSPALAMLFDAPALTDPLRVQALVLPLGALGLVPRARLERSLAMGRVALVDNVGTLVGAATLLGLAMAGAEVWAFVLAELANRAVQTIGAFIASPYRPRRPVRSPGLGELLRFGLYASGSRLLYNLYINTDYLVVGALLSEQALGLYAFAYRIVLDPTRGLTNVVARVAYPTLSRLQNEPERLHRYLAAFARGSVGAIGVLLLVGAFEAEPLMRMAGYERWLPAVPLVHWMAVLAVLQTATPLLPQLLNALGRARDNFVYSAVCAVVMPLAFTLGASFGGTTGVALAWVGGYPLVAMVLVTMGARALGISTWRMLGSLILGGWVLPVVGAIALALHTSFTMSLHPAAVLGSAGGLTAVGLGLVLWAERATVRRILRSRSDEPVPP